MKHENNTQDKISINYEYFYQSIILLGLGKIIFAHIKRISDDLDPVG